LDQRSGEAKQVVCEIVIIHDNRNVPLGHCVARMLHVPLVSLNETDIVKNSSSKNADVKNLVAVEPEVKLAWPPLLGVLLGVEKGAEEIKASHEDRPVE
jgi:hypothetical protein